PADPDPFRERSAATDSRRRPTKLLSLIAGTGLTFAALLTNTAAQPDCKTIDDFSKAKVGELPADWKLRQDSGKDAYRVAEVAVGKLLDWNMGLTQGRVRRGGAPEKKGEWVQ